jgi:hypothetical protein
MRGRPQYNFAAFDKAAHKLRRLGHHVYSPAEMDRAAGFNEWVDEADEDFVADAMRRDFDAIDECDLIVLLPGWEDSEGTAEEIAYGHSVGVEALELSKMAGYNDAGFAVCDKPSDIHTFATGSVRSSDADGVAYHLISPVGLRRLAETCREGAVKYGDYNWERGQPVGEIMNHAIRHCYLYLDGDRSEDHLAHAAWGLFAAMHMEERMPEMLDGLRDAG